MFSKTCEYALKAMIFICSQSGKGKRVCLQDIAEEIDSPVSFTYKVLQKLCKKNLLASLKGPTGGYYISEDNAKTLRIAEIVFAIDGNDILERCALGLKQCTPAEPCPMHNDFIKIRLQIRSLLMDKTLYGLSLYYKSGNTVLTN
ncbi:MAG: Rrf2 family transcriptional regulator [Chitinophagales bacterium]|nr:Rrf2 family transcriptional regulator [Bacteroidota bacterium]